MRCILQSDIFMRLTSKFYWRLTIVSRSVGETHKATFGSPVVHTLQRCIRVVNRDTTRRRRDLRERYIRRNSCTHARTPACTHVLCRGYHTAACFTYSHFFLCYFTFFLLRGANGFYVAGSLNRWTRYTWSLK